MENKMTKEQFIEQYGEAKVVFAYYYKYSFSFSGEFEGKQIYVYVGGDADDIYRLDVESIKEYQLKELDFCYAVVKKGETTLIEFDTRYSND